MSLRINHNLASVNGHRNLLNNNNAVSKSLEKLSSGLRINRAADDAAGLVISEQMRAQITGLNQAIDNSETAVSMVQTAEGALDEINSLLNKARELTLHAANEGANDTNQLAADQSELDNVISSISRIGDFTQFGTKKLLDGSLDGSSTLGTGLNRVSVGNLANNSAITTGTATFSVTAATSESNTLAGGGASTVLFSTGGTASGVSMGSETTAAAGVSFAMTVDSDTQTYVSTGAGMAKADIASKLDALFTNHTVTATGNDFKVTADATGSTDFTAALTVSRAAQTGSGEKVNATINLVSTGQGTAAQAATDISDGTAATLSGFATSTEIASGTVFTVKTTTTTGGSQTFSSTASGSSTVATVLADLSTKINAGTSASLTGTTLSLASGGTAGLSVDMTRSDDTVGTDFTFTMEVDFSNTATSNDEIVQLRLDNLANVDARAAEGTFITGAGLSGIAAGAINDGAQLISAGVDVAVTINGTTTNYVSTGGTLTDLAAQLGTALGADYNVAFITGGDVITGAGANFGDVASGSTITGTSLMIANTDGTDFTASISFGQLNGLDTTDKNSNELLDGQVAEQTHNLDTSAQTRTANTATIASGSVSNATGSTVNVDGVASTAKITTADGTEVSLTNSSTTASGSATYTLSTAAQAAGYNDVSVELTTGMSSATTDQSATFSLSDGAVFQVGANASQTVGVTIRAIGATELGRNATGAGGLTSLQDLLSSNDSALTNGLTDEALSVIDTAIDEVTNLRGDLGAFQSSTLESGLSSLRVSMENLTAAESTIRDVDFAAESADFTRNNILIQSATAMLAQANQLPQNVLQLLG